MSKHVLSLLFDAAGSVHVGQLDTARVLHTVLQKQGCLRARTLKIQRHSLKGCKWYRQDNTDCLVCLGETFLQFEDRKVACSKKRQPTGAFSRMSKDVFCHSSLLSCLLRFSSFSVDRVSWGTPCSRTWRSNSVSLSMVACYRPRSFRILGAIITPPVQK